MNIWLSETIVRAVGWTLVHFVWEGLVIAAMLAAALRVMRRSPAHWRYLAGCAAMVAMAVAPLVTFQLALGQDSPPPVAAVKLQVFSNRPDEPLILTEGNTPPAVTSLSIVRASTPVLVGDDVRSLKYIRLFGHQFETPHVVSYVVDRLQLQRLEASLPWLVIAWLVGVCLLSCRLLAGWWQVRRLSRTACGAAGEVWERKLAELARRLGVHRSIQLLQSALVEVPTVVGWLRPVILLPVSCLTGLSPGQLEAILAHELAHVRRHDYLINLLQSAVETLLFYHPAVWWVSRKVREERENCCDDLAVAVNGDRVGYARALATLEELRPASAQLALAAGGAPLLRRIQRLVGQPERKAGRASWPVAGIVLLLGCGLVALGMRQHRAQAAEPGTAPVVATPALPAITNSVDAGPLVSNAVDVAALVQDGKNLYEAGKYDEAGAKFNQVLAQDPKNVPAAHYMELIQEKRDLEMAMLYSNTVQKVSGKLPMPNPYARQSNVVNTNPGRKAVFDKLNSIRIDSLEYRDLPLKDVVDDLSAKSKADDSEGRGITFFFSSETAAGAAGNPTVDINGNIVGPAPPAWVDAAAATVHVSLQNVTMAQALDAILKTANPPLKYSVLDYGIMFSVRGNEPVPLEIRNFKVDTNTFPDGLTGVGSFGAPHGTPGVGGFGGGPNGTTNYGSIPFVTTARPANEVENRVRAYFAAAGIDLSTNSGKVVIYNDRKGMLTIRATAGDLDSIERALQVANAAPEPTGSAGQTNGPGTQAIGATAGNPYARQSNVVTTSPGRKVIFDKLHRIPIDSLNYTNLSLDDVLDDLSARARARDPDGRGINFFFSHEAPPAPPATPTVDANGNLVVATQSDQPDATAPKVNLTLKSVTLDQALDGILKSADRPIKYSVLDYGVMFSLRTNEPVPLEIRSFKVDGNTFQDGLVGVGHFGFPHGTPGGGGGFGGGPNGTTNFSMSPDTNATPAGQVEQEVRAFFSAVGVDLSTNTGKAVIWNERKGMLTIRATAEDLNVIERELQTIDPGSGATNQPGAAGSGGPAVATMPILTDQQYAAVVQALKAVTPQTNIATNGLPRVKIKVRFVEITQNDTKAFGFQWQLGGIVVGGNQGPVINGGTTPSYNGAPSLSNPPGFFPGTTNSSSGTPGAPVVVSTQIAPPVQADASNAAAAGQQVAPRIATITGVLTAPQNATVVQALKSRSGTEFYDAPEQTIQSGHEAQFQNYQTNAEATALTVRTNSAASTNAAIGPQVSLNLTASIHPDLNYIDLTAMLKTTEFAGYEVPGGFVPQAAVPAGGTITSVLPLPHFRFRETATRVTVRDGDTVALGGLLSNDFVTVKDKVPLLGDIPLLGRLFRSESTHSVKKNLMIFITVTLVNPDGTRFHSDDELPYRTSPPAGQ